MTIKLSKDELGILANALNEICNGIEVWEFRGWIRTVRQLVDHIETILNNPSSTKELRYGRSAYWGNGSGTIVIRDPKAIDGGADFQPTRGKFYFDETIK